MKSRKYHVRQNRRTRRKQHGGIKCNEPTTWIPFKWYENSCWLDTFILAFLHHPNKSINDYLLSANENIQIMKNSTNNSSQLKTIKYYEKILHKLLKIRKRLRERFDEPASSQAITKIREDIRDTLSKCPKGSKFKKGETSSIGEIFDFLADMFSFPRSIQYTEYIGNSINESNTNSITITGFDIQEMKIMNSMSNIKNIKNMKTIDTIVIQDILKKFCNYPEQNIIRQYTHFGDLIPINIERDDYAGGIIQTPIELEEYITLNSTDDIEENYRLVSVICNTGGHYVAYLACDTDIINNDSRETTSWLFYNDLQSHDKRIIKKGKLASWWEKEIPGYKNRYPISHATWLLYIKTT